MDGPDVVLLGRSFLEGRHDALPAALARQFGGAAILIIAGSGGDALVQLSLERGARGIVSKPISFDTVCDAVDVALGAPVSHNAAPRVVRMSFG
jgi:DNA-binding NarL/FixJ family response regulator